MVDNQTVCKGAWMIEGDEMESEYICPLRTSCYRYQARYQAELRTFFDIPPFSINMKDCPHYILWVGKGRI